MRLITLTTKNFKKLGSTTIEFTSGLNVLAGDNAQGKSTVLQAIKCALFGVSMVPGKKENIPTWGQNKFEVELHFEIGGSEYMVSRTGTTAKLVRIAKDVDKDELVANGTTAVSAAVEDLLGLASKDYGLFIESEQGASTGILTYGATALNRKVEEFAGVELIDRVQALAAGRSTRLLASAEAARIPQEELETVAKELAETEEVLNVANAAVTAAQAAESALTEFTGQKPDKDPEAMRAEQRAAAKLLAEVEQAERNAEAKAERATELSQRLKGRELRDAESLKAELTKVAAHGRAYAEKAEEISQAEQGLHKLDVAAQNLSAQYAEARKAHEPLVKSLEGVSVDQLTTALETAEAALQEASVAHIGQRSVVTNIKALVDGAECPTCGHVKEDHNPEELAKELEQAEAKSKELEQAWATADAAFKAARAALKEGTDKARVFSASERAVAELRSRSEAADAAQAEALNLYPYTPSDKEEALRSAEECRNQYAEINAQLKQVSEHNQSFTADKAAWEKACAERDQLMKDCDALNLAYEVLPEPPTDEEVSAVWTEMMEYEKARLAWDSKLRELQHAVTIAKGEARHASAVAAHAQSRLSDGLTSNEKADADEKLAKKYSRLVQFLRDRRQQYLAQVWETIMGISSKLVRESSGNQVTSISNRDGEFLFVEEGIEAPSTSASGAQKSFIGTALRVGLSRALYGSDGLLIFDEPTESCTERNAAGMAAMLASSAKQVLLITHRESDQALAQNIINVGE